MEKIFIGRQPILSKNKKIFGFELLFRDATKTGAHISDHVQATATVMANTLNNIGFQNLVGEKKGFVNVNAEMLSSGLIELLPPKYTVLEILEHVEVNDELINMCKDLRAKGYIFALDDFLFSESLLPLFDIAEYIKIEILNRDKTDIEKTAKMLKEYPVKLLAEKVETLEDFSYSVSLGFEYFQGYFFSKPEVIEGKTISPEQATLFKLFNSLAVEDDVDVIEKVFKQSPQLDFKLLKFMNSAIFYVRQKVTSIRHAITMLGYRNLQKWVSLLLFANQVDDMKSNPLLERSTMRGLIMEKLALKATNNRTAGDIAFIVGILSLMDALLGISLSEALSDLNLSSEISDALLKREGLSGVLLGIVEKLEQQDLENIEDVAMPFKIGLDDILAIETNAITEYEKLF
ncbi:MAG: HDOD domain-containing protein [Pseudomonadota bacterium]|nr:HDOD domain-containing protein [Pseudomonadota bacterium]